MPRGDEQLGRMEAAGREPIDASEVETEAAGPERLLGAGEPIRQPDAGERAAEVGSIWIGRSQAVEVSEEQLCAPRQARKKRELALKRSDGAPRGLLTSSAADHPREQGQRREPEPEPSE